MRIKISHYISLLSLIVSFSSYSQSDPNNFLFNGNNISNNTDFDNYLKRLGYDFKNKNHDFGGYIILKNKKIHLIMDTGSTPNSKYTMDYQSGALSFEIISNGKNETHKILKL